VVFKKSDTDFETGLPRGHQQTMEKEWNAGALKKG